MYTIAMDMDGVLYPFDRAFNEIYAFYGGEPKPFDRWIDFSKDFDDKLVEKVWKDPRLFRSQVPYADAQVGMDLLRDMPDVEVFLVTNPGRDPQHTIGAKWDWVQQYFPWIDAYHFITMHPKWLLDTDMIVEDFPGTVKKWIKHNPKGRAVMVERPWNTSEIKKLLAKNVWVLETGIDVLPELIPYFIRKEAINE